ncbi:adenylate kinase family protein [Salisediminibacterium beveridgei]|uniref:Uncharacterized protein n=1 Tax=Salisediminibacterium beveridgei TaxID=632773 RepID=A0A1D7QRN6_9BACI|nr:hypothetical protein [Salisediminibacterium beveridgei]AOM81659.1 hypothetical protein BBEV_0265 [Salisediminibacterium beveridgei]
MKKIEFIGIPGSGKSTLTKRLCELNDSFLSLSDFDLHYRSPISKFKKITSENLIRKLNRLIIKRELIPTFSKLNAENPDKLLKLQNFLAEMDSNDRYFTSQVLMNDYFKLAVMHQFTDLSSERYIVCDEHYAHRSGRIFKHLSKNDKPKILDEYFEVVGYPDVVIKTDLNPDIALKRMSSRKIGVPSAYKSKTEEEIKQTLRKSDEYSNFLYEYLLQKGIQGYRYNTANNISNEKLKIENDLST